MARAAEGSLRDSLSLLEQAIAYWGDHISDTQVRELLGVVAEEFLDELVAAIKEQSAERALGLVHRLITDGHNLQHFCREAIRHLRNLLVTRVCGAESELIAAPATSGRGWRSRRRIFSEEDLTRFFNMLLVTDDDLRRKPDPRVHLELGIAEIGDCGGWRRWKRCLGGQRAPGQPKVIAAAVVPQEVKVAHRQVAA